MSKILQERIVQYTKHERQKEIKISTDTHKIKKWSRKIFEGAKIEKKKSWQKTIF